MNVFVPDYDWNCHWSSPEEAVEEGRKYGECQDGTEFTMVRLMVGAKSTYRVIDGAPVLVSIAFPEEINPRPEGD